MILIQMLFGMGLLALGLGLLVSGLTARPRGWIRVGTGGLVLALVALLGASVLWHSFALTSVEWNPPFVDRGDIVGTWEAGPSRLALRPDGTFRLLVEGEAAERIARHCAGGTWALTDWNLTLEPEGGTEAPCHLRVVEDGGEYRILEQPGDLDGWDPWEGFQRTPAAVPRRR